MSRSLKNDFKWRQYKGQLILLCVRWYLAYPLAYEHVAELLAERGLAVDARRARKGKRVLFGLNVTCVTSP